MLGYFKPLKRNDGARRWLLLLVFMAIFLIAFFISEWWILMSGIVLVVLLPTGIIYNVPRLIVEGVILALVPPVFAAFCTGKLCITFSLAIIGAVAMLFGAVAFVQFKSEYSGKNEG
jgi:membrane glycosyltransferase